MYSWYKANYSKDTTVHSQKSNYFNQCFDNYEKLVSIQLTKNMLEQVSILICIIIAILINYKKFQLINCCSKKISLKKERWTSKSQKEYYKNNTNISNTYNIISL